MDSYQIVLFIALVGVSLLAYNTMIYKTKIEEYGNYHSADKKKELVFKRHEPLRVVASINHRVDSDELDDVSRVAYVSYSQFYFMSSNDIYEAVIADLGKAMSLNRGMRIHGPVYALVYSRDAPKENQSNTLSIGHNAPLTDIIVLYPRYKRASNSTIEMCAGSVGLEALDNYLRGQKEGVASVASRGTMFRVDETNHMFSRYINHLR